MIDPALDLLEGENNKVLYLPAITLGYLFTITGYTPDFVLAVFLIPGARAISDISEHFEDRDGELEGLPDEVSNLVGDEFGNRVGKIGLILVLYVVGTVRGWYLLYKLFDHTDIVVVGISIGYLGSLLIVLASSNIAES